MIRYVLAAGVLSLATGNSAASEPVRFAPADGSYVPFLRFSPDGDRLGCFRNGEVRIWDVRSRKELARTGTPGTYTLVGFDFSADGRRYAHTAGPDPAAILIRDIESGEVHQRVPIPSLPYTVRLSRDGGRVVGMFQDGSARVWNLNRSGWCCLLPTRIGTRHAVFSPSGDRLATGDDSQWVKIWRLADRKLLYQIGWQNGTGVTAFDWSPDGRYFVTATWRGPVLMWDGDDGRMIHTLRPEMPKQCFATCLCFSADSRSLAIGYGDGTVRILDTMTGRERFRWQLNSVASAIAFSPRGGGIATGESNGSVLLWGMRLAEGDGDLAPLWDNLADPDPVTAFQAIRRLAAADPRQLTEFHDGLTLTDFEPDEDVVRDSIGRLSSARFAEREKATSHLHRIRYWVEQDLHDALADADTPEAETRLRRIVGNLDRPLTNPDWLRLTRYVEALEWHDSDESAAILRGLADRFPNSRLAVDAAAALRRLSDRQD